MKIKLDAGAFMPVRAHDTDAGADLRSPVATVVPARGSRVIDTGVHIPSTEAAESIGVTRCAICNAVHGIQKTSGGYHWKYAD